MAESAIASNFNATGRRMAQRVAEELRGQYAVSYYDRSGGAMVPV